MSKRTNRDQRVSFPEAIHGHGHLCRGEARIPLLAVALERERYAYDDPWKLSAIVHPDDCERASALLYERGHEGDARLEGVRDSGEAFTIPELRLAWLDRRELRNDVHVLEIGPQELPEVPRWQHVSVELTPTPLAPAIKRHLPEPTRDGRDPFTWTSSVATFLLETWPEQRRVDIAGHSVTVELPRFMLTGKVNDDARTRSPAQLIAAVEKELLLFCGLLSFLERGNVNWTRIEVASADPADTDDSGSPRHPGVRTARRRSVTYSSPPDYLFPLVYAHALGPGDIDTLYANLRDSRAPSRLALAARFLISSHSPGGFLEEKLFAAFTGLEMVLSAFKLPPDQSRRAEARAIAEHVRRALTSLSAASSPAGSPMRERVERFLDGLARRPLDIRAAATVRAAGIEWADIWPTETRLEDGLAQIATARNALFHEGELFHDEAAFHEPVRAHTIAERLMFAALGGRPEWLNPGAYRHLPSVARIPLARPNSRGADPGHEEGRSAPR